MKKITFGLIIGLVIGLSSSVFADTVGGLIGKRIQGEYDVVVNGKKIDKKAIVVDGTSYLPVRKVGEVTGFNVKFDSKVGVILSSETITTEAPTAPLSNEDEVRILDDEGREIVKRYFEIKGEIETQQNIIIKAEMDIRLETERVNNYLQWLKSNDVEFDKNEAIKKSNDGLQEYIAQKEEEIQAVKNKIRELEIELQEQRRLYESANYRNEVDW